MKIPLYKNCNMLINALNQMHIIASAASSNDNAYAYRENTGELHSRQAKIGVNLP